MSASTVPTHAQPEEASGHVAAAGSAVLGDKAREVKENPDEAKARAEKVGSEEQRPAEDADERPAK